MDFELVLYSTHCPNCNMLEKKLTEKGYSFKIVDDVDTVTQYGKEHDISSAPILEVKYANDDTPLSLTFADSMKWMKEISGGGGCASCRLG